MKWLQQRDACGVEGLAHEALAARDLETVGVPRDPRAVVVLVLLVGQPVRWVHARRGLTTRLVAWCTLTAAALARHACSGASSRESSGALPATAAEGVTTNRSGHEAIRL